MIRALKKVGLVVVPSAGKGSHVKMMDPVSGHATTIPSARELSRVREGIVNWAAKHGYSKKKIIGLL